MNVDAIKVYLEVAEKDINKFNSFKGKALSIGSLIIMLIIIAAWVESTTRSNTAVCVSLIIYYVGWQIRRELMWQSIRKNLFDNQFHLNLLLTTNRIGNKE